MANYNKQDLTIDTPYGVVTRRVKVTVDDTGRSRDIDHRSIRGTVDDHVSSFGRPVFSIHVGKELTDGLEKYVFRAELDALVQHFQLIRGDV